MVDQARREMWLRHWRELLPGRETTYQKHVRRFAELDRTDPYPHMQGATPAPDVSTTD